MKDALKHNTAVLTETNHKGDAIGPWQLKASEHAPKPPSSQLDEVLVVDDVHGSATDVSISSIEEFLPTPETEMDLNSHLPTIQHS